MSTENVLVSIVMPAYNMERFIEAAIRSVQSQTFANWELLVIDDCSRDGTCEIVERLAAQDSRIRLIRNEENMGVARTRNRGIGMSAGAYVAFLDSDDLWHPEKLESQISLLERTGADLSYCSYAIVGEDGEKVKPDYLVPACVTYESMLKENMIGCSTVIVRSVVIRENPFGTGFYHEDYVLWVKLLKAGKTAAGCTEVLADWRYIENSRSFNKVQAAKNRWRIYRDYLELPLMKRIYLLGCYGTAGLRKYFRRK